ncbi:hypothetical protein GCM10011534_42360 [Pseudooceanicola nanhaiensis]|uniref:Uncharacterized protein n=1 Tax=Pseudooceanicola nanhaiensis TaxID=375761 RepID=A0A917TAK2_9RHOB|nr:hypothetical protein GCM10011534_42360 [Pseudooceanicola nanhaiensis]
MTRKPESGPFAAGRPLVWLTLLSPLHVPSVRASMAATCAFGKGSGGQGAEPHACAFLPLIRLHLPVPVP